MEAPEKSTRAGIQPQGIFLEFPHLWKLRRNQQELESSPRGFFRSFPTEAPEKSTRAGGERFFVRQKDGKLRNTLCISNFSSCMTGGKDPPSSRRGFFRSFRITQKIGSPCQAIRQSQNRKTREEKLRSSLQSIALHKTVTVRQIFSDGPGKVQQACSFPSAVSPFPRSGCLALPHGTDESRASI